MAYETYRQFHYTSSNNLGEYGDYYLQKYIILITDIMEKYGTMFMKNYGTELFSNHIINSLTREVLKKYNKMNIKLLCNYNIYSAFEKLKWWPLRHQIVKVCDCK